MRLTARCDQDAEHAEKKSIQFVAQVLCAIHAKAIFLRCVSAVKHVPYFNPVVAMPRMNVFCARKNSRITGNMTSIDAAMSRFQSVPPC